MWAESSSVAVLLAIVLSSSESETANVTALITKSPSPSYAVEGQNFTLEWTYTLDGTVGSTTFSIVNVDGSELLIGKKFGPGVITVESNYREQFRAQATDTRAKLTIPAVQRSDEQTYKLDVLPTGAGFIAEEVILVVNFTPNIAGISENQIVTEGGNVTLKCPADGKPTPNITWSRPSDNNDVIMPLNDIRRQAAGKYRCTADNGIGRPAIRDVWIVVQYPVEAKGFGENATVAEGGNKTFSCPVDGIPKPNITWYRGSEVIETPKFNGMRLEARYTGCYTCVASNSLGTSINITQCLTVEESSTAPTSPTSASERPSRTMIGVVVGVVVFVVIMMGFVTWWVCKKKKCRKHTKNGELQYEEVDQRNNGGSLGIEAS